MTTAVSILYGTGAMFTPERRITIKKGIRDHLEFRLQDRIQLKTKIVNHLQCRLQEKIRL